MSVLVQYLKFLKSSQGENEKKEKTAELPGYAPSVAGSIDNEKKDEDKLTSSITDHGLATQETPKNINASSAEPVAMRSSSSAAAPAFTQPVANPGRGYNTGVPRPQTQQQPTKIPRVLERIPMANSVNDPRSGTLLDKQGSLGYSRNTGISDVEGEIYVNSRDVELLGKLGFEYSCEEYLGLEKTSEVLDVYSYIEKVAGVPKEVAKLIDNKKAFSAEYLKDMGYSVPKGYEVKGDLVCPIEKKASKERVRVVLPYENQYLLEKLMNPKWPDNYGKRRFPGGGIDGSETPAQAASREFMEELGINASPDKFEYMGLDPTSGNHYLKLMEHGLTPGKYKASVGSDPYIYLEQGLPEGLDYLGADISKFAPVEKTEQSFQQDEKEKKGSFEKTAIGNKSVDRIFNILKKATGQKREAILNQLIKALPKASGNNRIAVREIVEAPELLTKERLRKLMHPEQTVDGLYLNKNIGDTRLLGMYDVDQNFKKLNFTPQISSVDELEREMYLRKHPEAKSSTHEALVGADNTKQTKITPEAVFKPSNVLEEGAVDLSELPKDKSKVYRGTTGNTAALEAMHNLAAGVKPVNRGGKSLDIKQNLFDKLRNAFSKKWDSPEEARYFVSGDPTVAASYSAPADKYWKAVDKTDYLKGVKEDSSKSKWFDILGKESSEKTANDQHKLVHYSNDQFEKLRPLTYEELLKNRSIGRWEKEPDKAKKYVEERKNLENYLRKRLKQKGILHDKNKTFLYATLDGREQYAQPDRIKHEASLTPEIINQSFFDVVGLPSRTIFGQKGLDSAIRRWDKNKDNLKTKEYMGMTIRPRIEIMTPAEVNTQFAKTAAADPAQTILITGHSGSGKTTLSRQLAEKLGIPVRRVDAHRGWDNYIRGDDKRWKETLTPGTKEHSYFTNLVNRATRDTLKNAPAAGIIEGTQLGHLSSEELAKFKAHIVAGGTRDQSIAQRIQRSVDKASKQGITFSPEEMSAKKIKAEYVANYWEPGVEKFRKLPGVLSYNHSEHQIDPLVEQLKHLMKKSEALVVSGIHGDEPAGDIAAKKLKNSVDAVTDVNPTEERKFKGKDINRHFDKPSAGSVQKRLLDLIETKKPSSVISLHEDDEIDKPYAYSSETMADKVKKALRGKRVASSAHGDDTDAGVIIRGKNPPGGSLEKALDKRDIPHATIETPSKSESISNRVKTHLDVVKDLLSKEAKGRCWEGYEPVPGKEAYSEDSCRPKRAKKKEVKKEAEMNTSSAPTLTTGGPLAIGTNPINIPTENLAQQNPPSVGTIAKEVGLGPADLIPVASGAIMHTVTPWVPPRLRSKVTRFNALANIGAGEVNAAERDERKDNVGKWIDRVGAVGGAMSGAPNPYISVPGAIISGGATALNVGRDVQAAREKHSGPPILGGDKPAFPTFSNPGNPTIQPLPQRPQYLTKKSAADHPLVSSNIKAVGHDKKEKVLEVAFHSGGEYKYKDVPRDLYARLLKAKSPGKFFNKHIKKDKPFEYEKVAGMPEHIRRAIATGDKALLQAAQSRSVASRIANIAAKKRKLEIARLLGNEEPKLLQRGEEFQKHFPFSVSHEFEQAKKTIDPSYKPDLSKYLGRMEG